MLNNKGFMATSIIYSFFLIFIAVLAALISNYVSNQVILDRFNDEVKEKLNNKVYFIDVSVIGAYIDGGVNITKEETPDGISRSFIWGKWVENGDDFIIKMTPYDTENPNVTYNCYDEDYNKFITTINSDNEMIFKNLTSNINCNIIWKRDTF